MTAVRPPAGIIGAALTPFTAENTVDRPNLDRLLALMAGHCDAISVLGAEVSEYRLLGVRDRSAIIRSAVELIADRVPVLAGASHPQVREVLRMADAAADAGAAFIQVLIPGHPGGGKATTADLMAYFEAIAAASPLPIIAYHNPSQGTDADAATLIELSDIDQLVGFKESSRDLSKIGRLCAEIDDAGRASYYTTMQPLLTTLTLGGSGSMMPPPGTLIGAEIVAAYRAGDYQRAATWQRHFRRFPGLWSARYGLTTTMKAAMASLGYEVGGPTAPFHPLPADDADALADLLTDIGVQDLLPSAYPATHSKEAVS